jgi:hypothetical protein
MTLLLALSDTKGVESCRNENVWRGCRCGEMILKWRERNQKRGKIREAGSAMVNRLPGKLGCEVHSAAVLTRRLAGEALESS